MYKDTGAVDAASILLNLDDYRVLNSERTGDSRVVLVEPLSREAACPACWVFSRRIQARPVHRVKDIDTGGKDLDLWVKKRRLVCLEETCKKKTFVQVTDQIPLRSRLTTRLVGKIVDDSVNEIRTITGVAKANQVAWTTVLRKAFATEHILLDVDQCLVPRLGIDEHRFRRIRYVLGASGKAIRLEPWSIVFTDLDTGRILDVIDGRRGKAVTIWMAQRPENGSETLSMFRFDL